MGKLRLLHLSNSSVRDFITIGCQRRNGFKQIKGKNYLNINSTTTDGCNTESEIERKQLARWGQSLKMLI